MEMEVPILTTSTRLLFLLVLAVPLHSVQETAAVAQARLLDDPSATSLANRFGKAPPPGVHPRVLIGPQELITLRKQIHTTETGKFVLSRTEGYLDVLHKPGKELAAVYDGLVKGDKTSLAHAPSDWWRGMVLFSVMLECYDAMLLQDEARGKDAAKALATLASMPLDSRSGEPLFNLALGYDFNFPYMTDEQRDTVRQAIASGTAGKKTYGAGLPADWENYNWMPDGTWLILSALAIEGEKGYDASVYPASVSVMKDFLHYGITKEGGPLEEMHYFHFGMRMGALALVAFSRRGDNLFTEPHYRALPNWLIASMEPFGDAFSTHQDTVNDQGGAAANYVVMKCVWPDDPVLDMVWRNRVQIGGQGLTYYGDYLPILLFPIDPRGWHLYSGKILQTKWGLDASTKPADYPNPVSGIENLRVPLNYWDPERGLLISRNQWQSDGLVVNFDINAQATGGGSHYHSNSTMFTLSALGRKWAIDRGFHIAETKDNSLILIDGRGQGFFPVGGKTAEYREDPNLTVISGDSSEPYHWITTPQINTGASYLAAFHWEPDTKPENIRKYGEAASVNKDQPWKDKAASTQYVYRAPYNPVERAFRTLALRRGSHSYVLIVDDIKKDASPHLFDWLMQVPDDLIIKDNRNQSVVLGSGDPSDNRRLIVQMVSVNGTGKWVLEDYEVKRSAETGDTSSFGKGKRLRYTTQAVDPEFRVLLYPYREGAALPTVSASGTLELTWPDQKDRYELTPLASGRTSIHMRLGH
jgi:hypothetical protein